MTTSGVKGVFCKLARKSESRIMYAFKHTHTLGGVTIIIISVFDIFIEPNFKIPYFGHYYNRVLLMTTCQIACANLKIFSRNKYLKYAH